jgi:hypothetical protein
MKEDEIARLCHATNRALQIITGDPAPSPEWDAAPSWQRLSAIEGVRHAVAGQSPEQLHESWCAAKVADGWRFGAVKDADAKTHPCLVAYADLPAEQKAKDAVFHVIVTALTQDRD